MHVKALSKLMDILLPINMILNLMTFHILIDGIRLYFLFSQVDSVSGLYLALATCVTAKYCSKLYSHCTFYFYKNNLEF